MQERGLARSGLAGNEHVLGHAPAQVQDLPSRGPRVADGHLQLLAAVERPDLRLGGRNALKGDLDPGRVHAGLAHGVHDPGQGLLRRGPVQDQGEVPQGAVLPDEPALGLRVRLVHQIGPRSGQVLQVDPCGHLLPAVIGDQGVHAAPRAAVYDAGQAARGLFTDARGEVRHDQEPVRLCQRTGLAVVLLDRLKLVAEVLLDDVLHVIGQVLQLLLDLDYLGPDPSAHQGLPIVAGVHESGEALAQARGIDQGEADPARRQRGKQPDHHGPQGLDRLGPALSLVLEQ